MLINVFTSHTSISLYFLIPHIYSYLYLGRSSSTWQQEEQRQCELVVLVFFSSQQLKCLNVEDNLVWEITKLRVYGRPLHVFYPLCLAAGESLNSSSTMLLLTDVPHSWKLQVNTGSMIIRKSVPRFCYELPFGDALTGKLWIICTRF